MKKAPKLCPCCRSKRYDGVKCRRCFFVNLDSNKVKLFKE